ncbi:MAG TPA: enoyl-CoA hydratase-related protein [Gammaproteobacteria bacterium]|nr:enoyl-CoA hydratase-related protein [Gammaproteobacteria bacterium]
MDNAILNITRHDSGILQLTLNRPDALNALNAELMEQFYQAFIQAKNDHAVKALLITGKGKAFSAGADIKQLLALNGQTGLAFAERGQSIFRLLEQLGKPSLAAVNGFALGGGCELAMAATLRIASFNAIFGQPEVKLGVVPGFGGTQRLARLVGKGRALDLCLTGKTITAEQALAWGLVNEIVSPEELLPRAETILTGLIHMGPIALRSVMSVIDHGYDLSLDDAFALEAVHFGLCCATNDKKEGVNAFIEKRKAVFTGE